ncbi:MAG: DUF4869 domain-containing protein [Clostridiales bacterium]|nr:DUF4869 domain-containing protein [Clostridiales bacterium]
MSGEDGSFRYSFKPEWFDDPFVKEMVKDVDKSVLVNHLLTYNFRGESMPTEGISGGVKTLIAMYKRPNYLYRGNAMGGNCAKWVVEIGKRVDCYMTLTYCMPLGGIASEKSFDCVVLNANRIAHTFKEFYREIIELLPDDGEFDWYDDLPEHLIKPERYINIIR